MKDSLKKDYDEIMRPSYIKCWQLVLYILNRWHTFVPFHLMEGLAGFRMEKVDAHERNRSMQMEVVWFFVPEDSTYRYEITKFLDRETAMLSREPKSITIKDETTEMFGVEVEIHACVFESPMLQPYLTEAQIHAMQSEMFKQVAKKWDREKGKDSFTGAIAKAMDKASEEKKKLHDPEDDQHIAWGMGPEDVQRHLLDEDEDDDSVS